MEQLTHPEIVRKLEEQIHALTDSGVQAAVLDAALLGEVGLDKLCDKLIFVDAPLEARLQRALARGWRKEDFTAREGAQNLLDYKHKRADAVIDNSSSSEQTLRKSSACGRPSSVESHL